MPVARQVTGWSWLYGAFVASSLWCVWPLVWRPAPEADVADAGGPAPGRAARWLWLLLPAAASALLVATTNRLTLDVASVPFLWILPLALYLVSFILCFAELYSRRVWGVLFAAGLAADAAAVVWLEAPSLAWQVAGPSWLLFTGCMVLHGETARLKPAPSRLTAFYLRLAGGAAVGAVLVALVAPRVFPDFWEYPILARGRLRAAARRDPPRSVGGVHGALARAGLGAGRRAPGAGVGRLRPGRAVRGRSDGRHRARLLRRAPRLRRGPDAGLADAAAAPRAHPARQPVPRREPAPRAHLVLRAGQRRRAGRRAPSEAPGWPAAPHRRRRARHRHDGRVGKGGGSRPVLRDRSERGGVRAGGTSRTFGTARRAWTW